MSGRHMDDIDEMHFTEGDNLEPLDNSDHVREKVAKSSSPARSPVRRNYVPEPCQPLPQGHNRGGWPVWELPILHYSELIGEQYEEKRKAVLTYFRDDVVKTTPYRDVITYNRA